MSFDDPLAYLLAGQEEQRKGIINASAMDFTPVVVDAGLSAAQSIAGTMTYEVIDYDTTAIDPRACVTTSPNWRFNALVGGYYLVSALCLLAVDAGWAEGEAAALKIYVNGNAGANLAYDKGIGAGGAPALSGSKLIHLNEDDYLEIWIAQSSGAGINIAGDVNTCWVSITRIS